MLLGARERGCAFDAWTEWFRPERWREAFRAAGIDPAFYAHRERTPDEVLPWSHLAGGASVEALARERGRMHEELRGVQLDEDAGK